MRGAKRFFNVGPLLGADFSALDLSTAANAATLQAALTAMGFTFSRASSATVQTAASTVVISGIGTDVPRIGDAGFGRGLCFEPARTNVAQYANDQSTAPWSLVGIFSAGALDSHTAPDGTTTAETLLENTAASVHTTAGGTAASADGVSSYTASNWMKKGTRRYAGVRLSTGTGFESTIDLQTKAFTASAGTIANRYVEGTANAWVHASITALPGAGAFSFQTYLSDTGGVYASYTGTSSDAYAWGYQVEAGKYPTELIVTTSASATRATDRLRHTSVSALLASNRLRFETKFIAKGTMNATVNEYGSGYLLTQEPAGTTTYAYINALRQLQVNISSGTAVVFRVPMSWERGDAIEVFVIMGDGFPVAFYRVNGGQAIGLGAASASHAVMSTASTDFYGHNGSEVLGAWVQSIKAHTNSTYPTWLTTAEITDLVWGADFTVMPLATDSNAAVNAKHVRSTGLTFARASAASVQSSANTVVTNLIATDVPRVGNAGLGQGLSFEPARTNIVLRSGEFGNASWIKNTGVTATSATGDTLAPDGSATASKIVYAATGVAGDTRVAQTGVAIAVGDTISVWLRTLAGSATVRLGTNAEFGTVCAITSTWQRFTFKAGAIGTAYYIYAAAGDNAAFTIYAWGAQCEAGPFVTEAITTAGATVTRATDRVTLPDDRALMTTDGTYKRIALEFKFIAKTNSVDLSGDAFLFYTAGPNYLYLESGTRKPTLLVNGTSFQASTGIVFSRGDVVEVWAETGANVTTVIKYRVNGGAVTNLTSGSPTTSVPNLAGNVIDFFAATGGGSAMLAAWIQKIAAYSYTGRPTWAV